MSKLVSMKFFKGHGPYNAGDIAGFLPEKAKSLKSVARPYNAEQEKELQAFAEAGDVAAVKEIVSAAEAEFAAKAAELEAREAALNEREAALGAEVPANPAAKSDNAVDGKGNPPAQGSNKSGAKG